MILPSRVDSSAAQDFCSSDREAFNKLWKALQEQLKGVVKPFKALDESLTKFAETIKEGDDLEEQNTWAMEPVKERQTIMKVFKTLTGYQEEKEKSSNEAGNYQEQKKNEKNKAGLIVVIILAILGCVLGGVCKWQKWCCFASKDDVMANEGGQRTDRTIFKKEVRSKNSHKRHARNANTVRPAPNLFYPAREPILHLLPSDQQCEFHAH